MTIAAARAFKVGASARDLAAGPVPIGPICGALVKD